MIKIPTHGEVICDIDAFNEKHEITSNDFGAMYLRDSGAVSRLRAGSDPRLSTVQKIYEILNKDKE